MSVRLQGGDLCRSTIGPELPSYPTKASLGELLQVTARALSFWPPLWVESFLGPASRWLPPYDELSEFTIVDPRRTARSLEYLSRLGVPAMHRDPPETLSALLPRLLNELLWRPTTLFDQPGPGPDAFPHERWFFINGIATNEALARLNAGLLTQLFHRPITVIQNATNSIPLDIRETAIGKEFKTDPHHMDRGTFTEPGLKATIAILEALNRPDIDRVVVIAHSQGTIIAANVLRAVSKALQLDSADEKPIPRIRALRTAIELTSQLATRLDPLRRRLARSLTSFLDRREPSVNLLDKLEIYTFANCADKMKYVPSPDGRDLPFIQHFANERDWVARLGILSPYRAAGEIIDIDGPLFLRKASRWPGDGWGHLLNEFYLMAIRNHLEQKEAGKSTENPYSSKADSNATARLYDYFHGGSPISPGPG